MFDSLVQYAMDMGAHIVVNSFSNTYWSVPEEQPGPIQYKQEAAYEDAIRSLNSSGILVFAAAGNEQVRTAHATYACALVCCSEPKAAAQVTRNTQVSNDDLVSVGYPNLPGTVTADCIVAVGATDSDGDRWTDGSADPDAKVKGSNYGAQTVDIGVPHRAVSLKVPVRYGFLVATVGMVENCCCMQAHLVQKSSVLRPHLLGAREQSKGELVLESVQHAAPCGIVYPGTTVVFRNRIVTSNVCYGTMHCYKSTWLPCEVAVQIRYIDGDPSRSGLCCTCAVTPI